MSKTTYLELNVGTTTKVGAYIDNEEANWLIIDSAYYDFIASLEWADSTFAGVIDLEENN